MSPTDAVARGRATRMSTMRVWLTKWWRQVTVGCLVVPAVILGFWALYEPRTGVFDASAALSALYLTLSMFTLNVVGPDPAPWSLQFARLFAAAASSSALIFAFFRLLRGNPDVARARKRRDHAVIVGTGPEALRLAKQYAQQGDHPVWVGDIDAGDIEAARGQGVTLPGPASDEMLKQILDGAKSVVITTSSDAEAVRLARQVDRATEQPPFLLLDSVDLAAQLTADHDLRVLPVSRVAVIAREAVANNPPIRDAACPPPIIVGDGSLAGEIVRQIARGWQEYGESQRIHCVGSSLAWVDAVAGDLEGLARLSRTHTQATSRATLAACRALIDDWTPPKTSKVASTGPAIIVAVEDDAVAVAVARGVQRHLPKARVSVVVESSDTWDKLLGSIKPDAVVSTEKLLGEPSALGKDRMALLKAQLKEALAQWSAISRGVFSDYLDGRDTAPDEDDRLAGRLTDRLLAAPPSGSITLLDRVLGSGGIEKADEEIIEAAPLLTPAQLGAMAAALLAEVGDLVPDFVTERDRHAWAVEFANWLPVAYARAGWGLSWPDDTPLIPATGIDEFAVALHGAYLVTSEQTDNATSSDLAHTEWPGLTEEDKAANRASARDVAVKIASLGLDWRAAPDHAGPWIPDDSTLTWLGEAEHRRWARHQVAHGRKHRFVEPWAMLDEKTKQYDTDAVLAHFSHLAEIGIEVFDPKEER